RGGPNIDRAGVARRAPERGPKRPESPPRDRNTPLSGLSGLPPGPSPDSGDRQDTPFGPPIPGHRSDVGPSAGHPDQGAGPRRLGLAPPPRLIIPSGAGPATG